MTILMSEGDEVWKSSRWSPALRSSMLVHGFDTDQYELRLAVRSDIKRGPTSTGPIQLVSVNADRVRLQGTRNFALSYMFFVVKRFGGRRILSSFSSGVVKNLRHLQVVHRPTVVFPSLSLPSPPLLSPSPLDLLLVPTLLSPPSPPLPFPHLPSLPLEV